MSTKTEHAERGSDGLTDGERATAHKVAIEGVRRQAVHSQRQHDDATHERIKQEHGANAKRLDALADRMEKEGPKKPA